MGALKRQREESPLPPTIVQIPEPVDFAKRRRILPPSLDGHARGWGDSTEMSANGVAEMDEEFILEDDCIGSNEGWRNRLLASSSSEYISANTLLHELHTFRDINRPPSNIFGTQPYFPHSQPFLSHDNGIVSPYPTMMSNTRPTQCKNVGTLSPPCNDITSYDEAHCVAQRYEETNKLLGSLFLSRRRTLDKIDSDGQS